MRAGRRPGRRRGVVGRQQHPKTLLCTKQQPQTTKVRAWDDKCLGIEFLGLHAPHRCALPHVSARRSTLNAVYRLTGLPVARGAARGSPYPRDIIDAPRSARLPARDRKRRSRGHLNVADVIAAEATRRRGSGSAVSTRCGPVRVDRASRRLAGPATRARATAGRAVGSLAGAGHLRARRVASRACSWRMLLCRKRGDYRETPHL